MTNFRHNVLAQTRPPGVDVPRLVVRLRDACNGHPYAKIPWPHRLLHEAADQIEDMAKRILPRTAKGRYVAAAPRITNPGPWAGPYTAKP